MVYDYDDIRYRVNGKKHVPRYSLKSLEILYVAREGSHILRVGGIRKDGKQWKLTVEEIIRSIEHDIEFYITTNNNKLRIMVGKSEHGKYIKTVADRESPSTLLRMPDFPA